MSILNELEKYLPESDNDYNYYGFRFDYDIDNLNNVDRLSYQNFMKDMSGLIDGGKYGVLEDVETTIYDDIVNVMGQLKVPEDVDYTTHKESVAEMVLNIYNHKLNSLYNSHVSGVEVSFDKDSEDFNKDEQ